LQGASKPNRGQGAHAPAPEGTDRPKQSVGQRWLAALILMPVVLGFVLAGGWWAFVAAGVVVIVCVFELYQMMLQAGYHPLIWISLALSFLFLVAAMLPKFSLVILQTGLGGVLLISFPLLFFRKKLEGVVRDWAMTLAISIYVGWSMSCFLVLRGYEQLVINFPHAPWIVLPRGLWWVLFVLLGMWGADSAAFFTGRYLGRHKLAPHISPGKTWEGVAGGLVLSVIAALILTVGPLGIPWYLAIVLGLLIGVAGVLGDLSESLIKRQMDVKDSGQLIPGHGGLLDRVDSLLFAVIVVFLFAQWAGK